MSSIIGLMQLSEGNLLFISSFKAISLWAPIYHDYMEQNQADVLALLFTDSSGSCDAIKSLLYSC